MRKMRRGTKRGIMLKFFKRRLTIQIRNIKNAMASDRTGDITDLLARFGALNKLKRSIKI